MRSKGKENAEKDLLVEISRKLDVLILATSLNGKDKKDQIKFLKSYKGPLSKSELQRVTGIDRHEF